MRLDTVAGDRLGTSLAGCAWDWSLRSPGGCRRCPWGCCSTARRQEDRQLFGGTRGSEINLIAYGSDLINVGRDVKREI